MSDLNMVIFSGLLASPPKQAKMSNGKTLYRFHFALVYNYQHRVTGEDGRSIVNVYPVGVDNKGELFASTAVVGQIYLVHGTLFADYQANGERGIGISIQRMTPHDIRHLSLDDLKEWRKESGVGRPRAQPLPKNFDNGTQWHMPTANQGEVPPYL